MSEQIFERHVDEYGNVSIRVSREFVVLTRDEAERLRERFDQLEAENAELRDEHDCVGMAAYDVGYKNGSVNYELEHCSACKNVADLQEALTNKDELEREVRPLKNSIEILSDALALCRKENKKLRELVRDLHMLATDHGVYVRYPYCDAWDEKLDVVEEQMRKFGIEVRE